LEDQIFLEKRPRDAASVEKSGAEEALKTSALPIGNKCILRARMNYQWNRKTESGLY
jgi:hypothetical protein